MPCNPSELSKSPVRLEQVSVKGALALWSWHLVSPIVGPAPSTGATSPAARLRDGWEFLQRLSSRLRIVENRSISKLDEDRGDLDSVARALGYAESERRGSSRRQLLGDYRRHTEATRAIYLDTLGVPPSPVHS